MTRDEIGEMIREAFRAALSAPYVPPMVWQLLQGFTQEVCGAHDDRGYAIPVFDMYEGRHIGVNRSGLNYEFTARAPMDAIFLKVTL